MCWIINLSRNENDNLNVENEIKLRPYPAREIESLRWGWRAKWLKRKLSGRVQEEMGADRQIKDSFWTKNLFLLVKQRYLEHFMWQAKGVWVEVMSLGTLMQKKLRLWKLSLSFLRSTIRTKKLQQSLNRASTFFHSASIELSQVFIKLLIKLSESQAESVWKPIWNSLKAFLKLSESFHRACSKRAQTLSKALKKLWIKPFLRVAERNNWNKNLWHPNLATFTRPFQIIQAQCKHHVNFVLSGDLLIKGHCRHHRYSAVKKIFEASPTIFRGLAFFGMKYLMQNLLSKEVHRQAEGWTEKLEIELGGGELKK